LKTAHESARELPATADFKRLSSGSPSARLFATRPDDASVDGGRASEIAEKDR
jgi:hypothetical protein